MDPRPKYMSQNFKTLRRKQSDKSSCPWIWQWIIRYDIKSMNNKRKTDTLHFIKI